MLLEAARPDVLPGPVFAAETRHGYFPLRGSVSAPASKPLLFVIRGIFPPKAYLHWMVKALPDRDVVIVDLPGMHDAPDLPLDLTVWVEAYRDIITSVFAGRRVVPVGVSTGWIAAVGLSDVCDDVILAEPFLRPSENPELQRVIANTQALEGESAYAPAMRDYIAKVLGLGEGAEPKDFTGLVRDGPRYHVVVGDAHPGSMRFPSLVSPAERAWWSERADVHVIEGAGHDLPPAVFEAILRAITA